MYLTDGHESTAMPRFRIDEMEPHDAVLQANGKDPLKAASAHLLDDQWFHHRTVQAGDIMLISHTAPHHGTENTLQAKRCVLFDLVSDERWTEGNMAHKAKSDAKWKKILDRAAKNGTDIHTLKEPGGIDELQWFPVRLTHTHTHTYTATLPLPCRPTIS